MSHTGKQPARELQRETGHGYLTCLHAWRAAREQILARDPDRPRDEAYRAEIKEVARQIMAANPKLQALAAERAARGAR